MWEKIKQSISSGDGSFNAISGRDIIFNFKGNVPTNLVDKETEAEVEKLRKSRFFSEIDSIRLSLRLGKRLTEDDLSEGSVEVRGRALAWCVRLLSRSEDFEQAEEYLEIAKTLGEFTEVKIAEAFLISQKGDKAAALNILAGIDLPVSHSAGLMIVTHHDGAEGALNWMNDTGYTAGDLDSDGKSFLLINQLQLGRWGEFPQTVDALSEMDFDETPILHHFAGLAKLVLAVPKDFRATVITQVPFLSLNSILSSESAAMDARRGAHQHFIDGVEAAKQLSCLHAARMSDKYALWLELCDPVQNDHGKNRLKSKLRDQSNALGFVHYALQFGIEMNLDMVDQDIKQNIAKNGGMTIDAAIARFTLAFMQPTPAEVANYIERHYNQLAAHLDAKHMRCSQIEMLSRAGLIERANEVLSRLIEEGIPTEQKNNLQRIISDAQGNDPIESHKKQFETTGDLHYLIILVAELEDHKRWDDLCKFGKCLFEKTHSLSDAERLVNALNKTHRSEELVGFLKQNAYLLSQSSRLHMSYAWGLFYEGAFLESRDTLAELNDEADGANYRTLQRNLWIATGDWASLSTHVADEYRNREDRSAYDLIEAAQLALRLGSTLIKDLVFAAAAKADGDSAILVEAYFIATGAGIENDPQIFQWLENAAKLSGNDGPLQRMNLKDLLDQKPAWDRHESEIWRLLEQGQIPIFIAAQSLNRTLVDLTTFRASANLEESDPRRRSAIPAYSGKRIPLKFDAGGKVAALDVTALLTLSFLKILDVALDAFEDVYIPHSTLGWLFEERHKAKFHQPSRIVNARKIRDLLATDLLEKFTPTTTASNSLSILVGNELSALITEAMKVRDGDKIQRIVVRSAPVHRLFSLMEEEVDLSEYAAVLSSCLAVVDKLRQKGQITADEAKRAHAYLQLQEKPWPNQPDIADGAILYLDDLAVTYFLHLGLLGKFKAAGLRAVVSQREVSETDTLISYEHIYNDVIRGIESIRTSLNSRIESGKVRVSRMHNFDELENKSILGHPSLGIIDQAHHCDLAIIDDRFINQHTNIDNGGSHVPIFSTLDLLDALAASGLLSDDDHLEHRTRLRRAAYFFVPVSVDELERCLRESNVINGKVVETTELKAIRESILRIRMSDWLQLPEETPWLDGTLKTFIRVLRNLWGCKANIEDITSRSNWLVEQIDLRGWAHSLGSENAENVVQIGRASHVLMLLMPPIDDQHSVVDAYWDWVEEKILTPIQEGFPEVYEWLVDWHRTYIAQLVETQLSGVEKFPS